MAASLSTADALTVIKGFCAKADGKDKLTALVQYACMFLSAGEPGNLKKVQASVTAARKVFRIMRPLECLTPLLLDPRLSGKQPWQLQVVAKLKDVLMAIYFAADHFVWAYQIGLISSKPAGERFQKISLWSWALGSVTTMVGEVGAISALAARRPGESDEALQARQDAARDEVNTRLFTLAHAVTQALTAVGLLQLLPFKPRTVGALGTIASAMNCYMLLPPLPKRSIASKPAPAEAAAGTMASAAAKLEAKVA